MNTEQTSKNILIYIVYIMLRIVVLYTQVLSLYGLMMYIMMFHLIIRLKHWKFAHETMTLCICNIRSWTSF